MPQWAGQGTRQVEPRWTQQLLILFHASLHYEMCQCATNQTQLTTRELELGESTATLTSSRVEASPVLSLVYFAHCALFLFNYQTRGCLAALSLDS